MDTFTPSERSQLMRRICGSDTKPEMAVRRTLHRLGYRFRLHRKDLPGKPDVVLPRHRRIVMVHGCFWHGHNCRFGSKPKSNEGYWVPKIDANRKRDQRNRELLRGLGWKVLELWECETKNADELEMRLLEFLREPGAGASRKIPTE